MGNLNRGPRHILVDEVNANNFGVYKTQKGDNVLSYKPAGILIPKGTKTNVQFAFGCTEDGNKETMLLDLNAPYPCEACDFDVTLNLRRQGKRQGGIDSHRNEAKAYSHRIASLAAASGTELADADKQAAMKAIVMQINHDRERFVNAGMFWVIEDDDYNGASTVTITLQNGVSYTVTTVSTGGLAAAINGTTGLSDYVTAYGPTTGAVDNERVIIESKTPNYFLVEAVTKATVLAYYLKLDVQLDNYEIIHGGGASTVTWTKMAHSRWTLDYSDATTAADDMDITLVDSDGNEYDVTTTGAAATPDATALALSQGLSSDSITGMASSAYLAATANTTDDTISLVTVGVEIADIEPEGTDEAITAVEIPVKHKYGRLTTEDMNDLFPLLCEHNFRPNWAPNIDQNADYCMISIEWDDPEHPDVDVPDGYLAQRGHVIFYMKKSLLPATYSYSDSDFDFWLGEVGINAGVSDNYMNEEPTSPVTNFWELLEVWYGSSLSLYVDPDGDGIGEGLVD